MRYLFIIIAVILCLLQSCIKKPSSTVSTNINWQIWDTLPPIAGGQEQPGLAGVFSGVYKNQLIIAGGANFPDTYPWNGGKKIWHDDVYIRNLDDSATRWKIKKIPYPLAYGLSFTLEQGILCVGGSDEDRAHAEVFLLSYENEEVKIDLWPSLPMPLSNMSGTKSGDMIYVLGGQSDEKFPEATSSFFALNVKTPENGWIELPSWPGPPRAFSIAVAQSDGKDSCVFLFSGRNFSPGKETEYLHDGYKYTPRTNEWIEIDNNNGKISFNVMAGMAIPYNQHQIVFIGGADSRLALQERELSKKIEKFSSNQTTPENEDSLVILNKQIRDFKIKHPGFSRKLIIYDTQFKTMSELIEVNYKIPVTTNIVSLDDYYLITSGEIRPGVRTPLIYIFQFRTSDF